MDRAVLFALFSKIWLFIGGPVSALLIANFFTPELQGYYYTFGTLLALQAFVELGLGTVTQQFASHEWAKLKLDVQGKITGDPNSISKLISIAQISFKWFLYGAFIIVLGLLVVGYFYFSSATDYHIAWQWPWITLSVLTGFNILFVPLWSLLEGCNQVKNLYAFRFFQGIVFNIIIWIAILSGLNLWAACLGSIGTLICASIFIRTKYWRFFKDLITSKPSGPKISWKSDMFHMHWRIAVTWVFGYFCFSLFIPVLFKYRGAEVAGQFGMTWNIITAIGGMASAWLSPRIPEFGILISKNDYLSLDKLFWKIVKLIFVIITGLSLLFMGVIYLLPLLNIPVTTRFASRLLPPLPTAILLMAQIVQIVSTPFSGYMRAHKKEPGMYLAVLSGILIALSTFFLGKYYSVTWVAIGYLAVNVLVTPLLLTLWYRFKKKHQLLNDNALSN